MEGGGEEGGRKEKIGEEGCNTSDEQGEQREMTFFTNVT